MPINDNPFTWAARLLDSGYSEPAAHRKVSERWTALEARVAQLETLIIQLVPAGYGGIIGAGVVGNDLGSGWDTLSYIWSGQLPELGVTSDFANGTLSLSVSKLWRISLLLALTHNESTQGRTVSVRLFNQTQSIPGDALIVPIARNQPGSIISLSLLFDVLNVNDVYVLEIGNLGGGDTITGITYDDVRFEATHVSELGSLI